VQPEPVPRGDGGDRIDRIDRRRGRRPGRGDDRAGDAAAGQVIGDRGLESGRIAYAASVAT